MKRRQVSRYEKDAVAPGTNISDSEHLRDGSGDHLDNAFWRVFRRDFDGRLSVHNMMGERLVEHQTNRQRAICRFDLQTSPTRDGSYSREW